LRKLIEENRIPEDVTVQVLTQCRDHIIRKTFEAVKGAPRAVIHFYNSTSYAQREQVFKKSKEEIKAIAVEGAKLVKQLSEEYEGNFLFEYSPESFTGTEPEYAVEVCNAVLDVMQPTPDRPMIINLPVTVEMSLPHIYANQIEYCSDRLKYRDSVILSTHPHNDRGTGVADTELALLAGAQRVECCLFGNGERTGNVDAITLAMNMYSHGVDPKLDFSNMPEICAVYERVTRMHVNDRQPYAGSLVFAAFSGSHQDAIAKGMAWREDKNLHQWTVPYLPIDPKDVSRTYDADVIRINSQSGKGGIGFVLENAYGYNLPPKMREHFGYVVKGVSDHAHAELKPEEVYDVFEKTYLNKVSDKLEILETHFMQGKKMRAVVKAIVNGEEVEFFGEGNGRLNAVNNALKSGLGLQYTLETYSEHSMDGNSASRAAGYVGLVWPDSSVSWGAGTDPDIIQSGIRALVSAINNKINA
jgi:2-isopropylmalate synthase